MATKPRSVPRRVASTLIRAARLTKALAEAKRFYRSYVSKTAFAHTVERTATTEGSAGVAIVALFPRGPLLESVTRLISTLVAEHYLVIAVVNKTHQSPEWLAALAKLNITLLSRPNVGRDFGAYKVGYLFAEEHGLLTNAVNLIFANDSVYYGPRSQDHLVELLNGEHPWTAMFVNHQHHTHAQSFFLRFGNELFSLPAFRQFWRSYYPSEAREHTIDKGEVKLSATLIGLGYAPYGFVSVDRILSHPLFGDFTESEKHAIRRFSGQAGLTQPSLARSEIEALMRAQSHNSNLTHAWGGLSSRVLGTPLKLDLSPSWVTQEGLYETLIALGCSVEEATIALAFILKPPGKRLLQATPVVAVQAPHK